MARRADATGRAHKRSQRQIQLYVNELAPELSRAILEALPTLAELRAQLNWKSPLEEDDYREYRDGAFLKSLMRGGTRAGGERRERIERVLAETRRWLGVAESDDVRRAWRAELYQSANHYAYLCWFNRKLKGERAWLANMYFIADPDAHTTRVQWEHELADAERRLGLDGVQVPNAGRVFLTARDYT
jgi:hypothetical protein